jgi:hypothetical protein
VSKEKEAWVRHRDAVAESGTYPPDAKALAWVVMDDADPDIKDFIGNCALQFSGGFHSRDPEVDALTKENAALRAKVEQADELAKVMETLAAPPSNGPVAVEVWRIASVALTTYKGEGA